MIDQSAPATKPNSSHSTIVGELPGNSFNDYRISTDLSSELRVATLAYFSIQQEFNHIGKAIKSGATPKIERISPLLEALVASVIRNPAAGVWLARLKSKSSYAHRHCISCAILCAVMGRQLGLDEDAMFELGLGGLFMDSGKLLLPDSLLRKTQSLTEEEQRETHSHTELGLKAVKRAGLPDRVVQVIQHHHERFDGSGYPAGLKGTDIHLYARIAAIVDCYDAMTSPRYYATPIPHSEAIMKLASWRKTLFQKELVELTNGEVAVVSEFRPGMGRKPELTVILNREKKRLPRKRVIVLTGKEGTIDIARNLPPDAYDLDPEALF